MLLTIKRTLTMLTINRIRTPMQISIINILNRILNRITNIRSIILILTPITKVFNNLHQQSFPSVLPNNNSTSSSSNNTSSSSSNNSTSSNSSNTNSSNSSNNNNSNSRYHRKTGALMVSGEQL
jgi:hypothetical protein